MGRGAGDTGEGNRGAAGGGGKRCRVQRECAAGCGGARREVASDAGGQQGEREVDGIVKAVDGGDAEGVGEVLALVEVEGAGFGGEGKVRQGEGDVGGSGDRATDSGDGDEVGAAGGHASSRHRESGLGGSA